MQPDYSGGVPISQKFAKWGYRPPYPLTHAPINNRDAHQLHWFDSASVGKVGALVEVQV